MHDYLIEILACPACHGELAWAVKEVRGNRISLLPPSFFPPQYVDSIGQRGTKTSSTEGRLNTSVWPDLSRVDIPRLTVTTRGHCPRVVTHSEHYRSKPGGKALDSSSEP